MDTYTTLPLDDALSRVDPTTISDSTTELRSHERAGRAGAALVARRWANRTHARTCAYVYCKRLFFGDVQQLYCTYRHNRAAAAKRHRDRERDMKRRQPARPSDEAGTDGGEG